MSPRARYALAMMGWTPTHELPSSARLGAMRRHFLREFADGESEYTDELQDKVGSLPEPIRAEFDSIARGSR